MTNRTPVVNINDLPIFLKIFTVGCCHGCEGERRPVCNWKWNQLLGGQASDAAKLL